MVQQSCLQLHLSVVDILAMVSPKQTFSDSVFFSLTNSFCFRMLMYAYTFFFYVFHFQSSFWNLSVKINFHKILSPRYYVPWKSLEEFVKMIVYVASSFIFQFSTCFTKKWTPHRTVTCLRMHFVFKSNLQKQPSRGALRKRCSKNIQPIYRRTPMPKWFIEITLQLYSTLLKSHFGMGVLL